MSLIAELKRRSVFKVGAAYLVVAWLVIQVAVNVLPQFETPAWFLRAFMLIVALGFPIALVLAWVFDLTPEGIKVEVAPIGNKRMYAIAALLAAIALGWYWKGQPALDAVGGGADARSIAVLPFVNMSGDTNNEYFSDGISEEILNVLARTPELSVAARTSSFQFKGEKRDVAQIAAQLKVRMVLEGSVRKQGERVRITAQLIDAASGFHLWSQTYDRDLKDIFAIQDEIARAIGNELKVRVGGKGADGAVANTTDVEAHDLYLRGLASWQARTEDSLWAARDAFASAVAADPKYAQAQAGLALTYAILPDYSGRIGYDDSYQGAREAAEHALILDPLLPEAYAALGAIEGNSGHPDISIALLKRAIALNPSYATAHQWLGNQLVQVGDLDGSIRELKRAGELDPKSLIVAANLSGSLLESGRYDEAIEACKPVLESVRDSALCPQLVGAAQVLAGRIGEARQYYETWARIFGANKQRQVIDLFDALEGRADRGKFARTLVATPHRSWYDAASPHLLTNWDIALLLMVMGRREETLAYIERNAAIPEYAAFASVLPTPVFDPIRCDPRFVAATKAQRMVDARHAKVCGT